MTVVANGVGAVKFLPGLTDSLRAVTAEGPNISTLTFTVLIDHITVVFDYLGTVLQFAKTDLVAKNVSLKQAAPSLPLLRDVVAADKQAGLVQMKNSRARNLHRLTCVIKFMRLLLEKLCEGPHVTTRDAAWYAYEQALSPIHTYVVRKAVQASMYMLPSREAFMQSIQESNETAKGNALEFISNSQVVIQEVERFFDVPMPTSESKVHQWFGSSLAPAPA